jgi:hypothetical protein
MRTISLLLSVMTVFLISTGISLCQTVSNSSFNGTTTGWDNCGLGSDAVPELKYSKECYDDATTGTCVQYGDGSGSDNNNCGAGCTGNPSPDYMAEVDQGNSKGLCQNISGFTSGTTRTLYLTLGRRTDFRGGGGAADTQIIQVCIGTACTTITRTSSSTTLDLTTTAWTFTVPATGTLQLKITNISSYAGPDNGNYGMIFSYIGFSAPTTPVTLTDFNAVKNGGKVDVDWQTASEKNNHYFVVEKSKNSIDFISADTIAGAGNSASPLSYHTADPAPYTGTSYYRLKQLDYDGQFSYSKIVSVENDGLEINIYPNPSLGSFKVDVSEKQSYHIEVTDMEGRLVCNGTEEAGSSSEISGLPGGVYVVRIVGQDAVVSRKLVVL